MNESKEIEAAMYMLKCGENTKAANKLLQLKSQANSTPTKLQILHLLLNTLDPIKNVDQLITISTEGEMLAKQLTEKDLQAYFMARKAAFLQTKSTFLDDERRNLNIAPGWFEFSTQDDKQKHTQLTKEIRENKDTIIKLLSNAETLANEGENTKMFGEVLMIKGSTLAQEYLHLRSTYLMSSPLKFLWANFDLMKNPLLERTFIFSRTQAKKLKNLLEKSTEYLKNAAKILKALNDPTEGYVYHNLANTLRSANMFKQAKFYGNKAITTAEKYNDQILKEKATKLVITINSKNRDIPNYIAGKNN